MDDRIDTTPAVETTTETATPDRPRRRLHVVRGHTERMDRVGLAERVRMRLEGAEVDAYDRPQTRGDCLQGEHAQRPCPFVGCGFNLYLDVNPLTGSVKLNFPDIEPWEMVHSCALDVADEGGDTLENVGHHLNLTRERVRQVEQRALDRMHLNGRKLAGELPEESPVTDSQVRAAGDDFDGEFSEFSLGFWIGERP